MIPRNTTIPETSMTYIAGDELAANVTGTASAGRESMHMVLATRR